MIESRFTVVLRIEPFVLCTAMADCLAADPRLRHLDIRIDGSRAGHRPVNSGGIQSDRGQSFVFGVELSEPPSHFAITVDGTTNRYPYHGLDDLAGTLANVANARSITY